MAENRPRRVLVVDDDEAIRELLGDVFALEGFESRAAEDGQAALDLTRDWTPDVIVLDLMMPGMDGWQFRAQQRLRPDLRAVPVIVVSASQRSKDAGAELQADGIVDKPFDIGDLIHQIELLIGLNGRPRRYLEP